MTSNAPGGYAVLFVDDEEKALKYFRMAYARDFRVITAGSVAEALAILDARAGEIGVLITDQRMPGQQGVELLKRAREDWPDIVRILTTAYSDLEDAIAAVNRGEILRYVTKPWDIQALRVELLHAMDFFVLRRERDILLSEKLSVRQRMLQSDRLRGVLGIAAATERLRHAPHAAAAWVRDLAAVCNARPPHTAALELWGLDVEEAAALMALAGDVRALEHAACDGFPDRVSYAVLARSAGLAVTGSAPEVAGCRALLGRMLTTLGELAGPGAVVELDPAAGPPGPQTGAVATFSGPGAASESAGWRRGLFAACLIASHHGGTLAVRRTDAGIRFDLQQPADPASVVLPEPDTDWLMEQFATLEDWER